MANISLSKFTPLISLTLIPLILNAQDITWSRVVSGLPSDYCVNSLAVKSGDDLLVGGGVGANYDPRLYISSNSGDSWQQVTTSGLPAGGGGYYNSLVITSTNTLFMGSCASGEASGVFRSTNNGSSWSRVVSGLPDGYCVNSLVVKSNDDLLVGGGVGTNYDPRLYISTNSGGRWQQVTTNGLPTGSYGYYNSLVVTSTNTLFMGSCASGEASGVFRSTNSGSSWSRVVSGLPDGYCVNSLMVKTNDDLLVGGFAGANHDPRLYISTNNGGSWQLVTTNGLPAGTYGYYNSLVGTSTNTLFMGSCASGEASGVFRSNSSNDAKNVSALDENSYQIPIVSWPNPFNALTFISFTLPGPGYISLRVLDLLGREVAVLKDGFAVAGSHRLILDGNGLASGIYFAQLEAGGSTHMQKLVLLK